MPFTDFPSLLYHFPEEKSTVLLFVLKKKKVFAGLFQKAAQVEGREAPRCAPQSAKSPVGRRAGVLRIMRSEAQDGEKKLSGGQFFRGETLAGGLPGEAPKAPRTRKGVWGKPCKGFPPICRVQARQIKRPFQYQTLFQKAKAFLPVSPPAPSPSRRERGFHPVTRPFTLRRTARPLPSRGGVCSQRLAEKSAPSSALSVRRLPYADSPD